MAREDYYSLLGLDKQAPDREIKRAYYNLARDLHPDRAKSPEEARVNAERLAIISKAYNTLKDPQKRAEYDGTLKGGSAPTGSVNSRNATPPPKDPPRSQATKPPAAAAGPGSAAPKPAAAPAAPANSPKVSANDIQSQRVLTAQKAFVKGMEFYKTSDYKRALPFFEAAVQNDPESEPHYHMKLANCLIRTKGSFTRAVQAAEKATSMDAYNMEFKFGLSEIYETVGATSKAITVYEDILKWEPENDKARMRLQMLKVAEAQRNPTLLAKIFPSIFGKK